MDNNQIISLLDKIPSTLARSRLDQALAHLFPQYSRSQLQNWIKAGFVKLDGTVCTQTKQKVNAEQTVAVQAPLKEKENWTAQDIALDIVYEDDAIIIVNKPPGLVVHPGAGNPDQTLVNALLHYAPNLIAIPRAGIIHRLDKDTSGLLIVTKTLVAHHAFTQALKARAIKREYLALVKGVPLSGGSIDAAIGRHPRQRTKMAVSPTGRPALTHYRILEKFPAHTLLQVELTTGRTHQIRVHLSYIRYPVVGDPLYDKQISLPHKLTEPVKKALQHLRRQALHAFQLTFTHPITQQDLQFQAPLPTDLQNLLSILREEQ